MNFRQEDFTYTLFLVTIDYFVNDRSQLGQRKPRIPITRAHFPKPLAPGNMLFSLAMIGRKLYFTDLNVTSMPKKEVTTDNFPQILLLIWRENAYLSHGEPKCYSPFKSIVTRWLKDQPLQSLMKKHSEQLTGLLPMLYWDVLQIVVEYALESTEVDLAIRTSIGLFKNAKQTTQVSEIATNPLTLVQHQL